MNSNYAIIWHLVSQIPFGKVATYGQIAKLTGLNLNPRIVAYALRATPEGLKIPWYRIINSKGKISFPEESYYFKVQKAFLENEEIHVIKNKISLSEYLWNPVF